MIRVATAEPTSDRQARIADAALCLLAREGAKGLTHRAVDAELKLPAGSTSYYCRTRAALLLTAAQRLLALDAADAEQISSDAAGLSSLLGRWLSQEGRTRSLARMELLLAAAREPGLDFMVDARQQFIAHAQQALGGPAHSRHTRALSLVALMDGLTLHGLVTGSLSSSDAQRVIAELLGQTPRKLKPRAP